MTEQKPGPLADLARSSLETLNEALSRTDAALELSEIGTVSQLTSGIAHVRGFTDLAADELLAFPGGLVGIASDLAEADVGVILLGAAEDLRVGDEVTRTHRVVDVPVGDELLGRVVDAVGRPLDDAGPVRSQRRRAIERPAPAIMDRAPVSKPLQTGLKAVDAAIPIGRGQRELIIGDRQTGKTAIALAAIMNQKGEDIVAVYCAIGQRGSAVAKVVAELQHREAMAHCVVVVAGGDDPPGLQFVAPYAATSIAEYFLDQGRDVLIVYDDLTRHARAYRELSLLLRRPPGREAYPGDIFYIHSRLLERATHLRDRFGGGSLTALPVIETQAQNISAYIPTNLISITDGQIYVSPELFRKGHLPAIDIGKSVSRVGGKAQLPAFRAVAGDLRLSYSQFEELEAFARFGTRLDEETRRNLERGRRVREVLKQGEHDLRGVAGQVAVLLAVTQGVFDKVDVDKIGRAEDLVREAVEKELSELCRRMERGEELEDEDRDRLLEVARKAVDAEDVGSGG